MLTEEVRCCAFNTVIAIIGESISIKSNKSGTQTNDYICTDSGLHSGDFITNQTLPGRE
jgi:hypothetical protein